MSRPRLAAALAAVLAALPVVPVRAASPALCATLFTSALVNVGQTFTVRMLVHDCGDTALTRVTPSLPQATAACTLWNDVAIAPVGAAAVLQVGSVSGTILCPVELQAGFGASAYAEFTWQFKGTAPGLVAFTMSVAGLEVGGSPGATPFGADTVTVGIQRPAALSATLTVDPPGQVPYGSTVTVYLDVMNNGDAAADDAFVYSVTIAGTGSLSALPCPLLAALCKDAPPLADIAPGPAGHRTWTWRYLATAAGGVTLFASAGGWDHNTAVQVVSLTGTTTFIVPVPPILSWTITGAPVVVQGQDAVFKVRATNQASSQVCVTALSLQLNGQPGGLVGQTVISEDLGDLLLPACLAAGAEGAFTVRARVADVAPPGPGGLTAAWTGQETSTGIPVLGAGDAHPLLVTTATRLVSGIEPNPWRPDRGALRVGFTVPPGDGGGPRPARVEVLTLLGEVIRVLADDARVPGAYEVAWDGKNRSGQGIAAGVVLIQIRAGHRREVRKLAVIR